MFKNSGYDYSVINKKILKITKQTVFFIYQINVTIWEAHIIYGKDVPVKSSCREKGAEIACWA